jgi:hypothetical protein
MHHSGGTPCPTPLSCEISPKATFPFSSSHQNDPDASRMAAFLSGDPSDRDAFRTHWKRILADPIVTTKGILWNGEVAGSIGSFLCDGKPQVNY